MTNPTADEPAPSFPVDDTTLDLVWSAIHPGPEAERSSLGDLLTMLGNVHEHDVISALIQEVRRQRGREVTEAASPTQDRPEPNGLVFMLIEFDEQGESVGRSWPVEDPGMAAHLLHLASHLGEPMTDASFSDLNQVYVRVDPDEQPPTAEDR